MADISPFNDELHVVPVEGATLSGLSANSDASTVVFRVAIVSRYPDRWRERNILGSGSRRTLTLQDCVAFAIQELLKLYEIRVTPHSDVAGLRGVRDPGAAEAVRDPGHAALWRCRTAWRSRSRSCWSCTRSGSRRTLTLQDCVAFAIQELLKLYEIRADSGSSRSGRQQLWRRFTDDVHQILNPLMHSRWDPGQGHVEPGQRHNLFDARIAFDARYSRRKSRLYKLKLPIILFGKNKFKSLYRKFSGWFSPGIQEQRYKWTIPSSVDTLKDTDTLWCLKTISIHIDTIWASSKVKDDLHDVYVMLRKHFNNTMGRGVEDWSYIL